MTHKEHAIHHMHVGLVLILLTVMFEITSALFETRHERSTRFTNMAPATFTRHPANRIPRIPKVSVKSTYYQKNTSGIICNFLVNYAS
jgi:hypothetical protein